MFFYPFIQLIENPHYNSPGLNPKHRPPSLSPPLSPKMTFVYDPEVQLPELFPNEDSLENISAVLTHLSKVKQSSAVRLESCLSSYQHPVDVLGKITTITENFEQLSDRAENAQQKITQVTLEIQKLDVVKQNLVLSMKVLKRLQMLVIAYNSLNEVVHSRDYEQIASYLGAVHELMKFFKDYKSIDEIALLNQRIHQTQNKLVDDIFIDFEDSFTNNFTNDKLRYGCEVLELVDHKYKDKLLTWFYNLQLKEILSIFSTSGEAGGLDNLGRRYIYFSNILSNIRSNYLQVFPDTWGVDLELAKLFSVKTGQDISSLLGSTITCSSLLEALTKTLAFEKQLNGTFNTTSFTKLILRLFEPFLQVWIDEQDTVIRGKFTEFYAQPKVPSEILTPQTATDLVDVLRVNGVPNFAPSSVELFKVFQKSLQQTLAVSTGKTLFDLHFIFKKFLSDYMQSILLPTLQSATEYPKGIESIKYLTMVLNTADYVIKNIDDLQEKVTKLVDDSYKEKITFESEKEGYFELISNAIRFLIQKVHMDLGFLWKQFENNGWDTIDAVSDTSSYMEEFIKTLREDHRVICPLIIRDGYVRNYADKLIEMVVAGFKSRITQFKTMSIIAIEQILFDVSVLKKFMITIPMFSDANYDDSKTQEQPATNKGYVRHLNAQFSNLETVLHLLLTPSLPVDNVVERYMVLIGDKSINNFQKFLHLKNIQQKDMPKYVENFKLQITLPNSLQDESPIMTDVIVQTPDGSLMHPSSQQKPEVIDFEQVSRSRSPEAILPDFLKTNTAKIQTLKFNNALRDFSISGENHVNKFNENFKNFGKFFRKDE